MEAIHQSLPSSSASTFFSHRHHHHHHHHRSLLQNPSSSSSSSGSSSSSDVCLKSRRPVGRIVAVKAGTSERTEYFSGNRPLHLTTSRRLHATQVHAAKQTFSSFDDLLKNTKTALLVDFYATWCGPCQFMVPVLHDVGKELKDKLRIVKIDTEKYPNIASRYGVQALPTLMLFQNGEPIDRLEGAMSARDLVKRIEEVLSASKA